ncbi:chemotaxis protein CheR [Pseudomonas sp. LPB0260]|uniref:CheR family methyltransferase n=1 Tax=Pseudomonas sp. LPB0260 TaxID=2614442 RepID=UPI0015C1D186|nr:CheR family methyltransferase [Pseudomonas sp. LPB0260]QLC72327.1 chemotaxis protein CheR [Pseudomonas sp. LPB0260]QLC75104.1 chemotaxis protein CheR [Pseudomonas sp. LPB0260]
MLRAEPSCSPRLLKALSHKVLQHLGLDFAGARQTDLLRRLQLLALEREVTDFDKWLQALAFADWNSAQEQGLIAAFTVGETYFRRDSEAFDWLAAHHLAPLLARRRREGRRSLRLWSAGCCTGEEAYGLLFLIDELLAGEREQWNIELVASDINAAFIARAEQGLYGKNAFRVDEEGFRQRHFQAEGRQWRVRPAWRGRIRFVQYNLADNQLPPALASADLILCRNVLMYFSPARAQAALRRLLASLSPDGVLLLSAVEAGLATQAGLQGRWAGCNYAVDVRVPSSVDSVPFPTALPSPLASLPVPRRAERPSSSAPQPGPITATAAPGPNPAERERRNSEDYWQRATQAQAAGQHEQAREALLAYLGCATPGRAQQHRACLAMARSWADQQHVEQAREWLQRALALDCAAPAAYWLEALLAQQAGDNRAALAALHKALYLDPEFILGYFLRARLLHGEGQRRAGDKALQVCRQLLLTQDGGALVAHGDGISCAQLLRLCDQLQQEAHICPSL